MKSHRVNHSKDDINIMDFEEEFMDSDNHVEFQDDDIHPIIDLLHRNTIDSRYMRNANEEIDEDDDPLDIFDANEQELIENDLLQSVESVKMLDIPLEWPKPFDLFNQKNAYKLDENFEVERNKVIEQKFIYIRTVTWNLFARKPPPCEDVKKVLLPIDQFHLYFIGTEECERSIAQSALNASKKQWESYLIELFGINYVPLRAHTLQATHIIAFVHKSIVGLCSSITSGAIPTGFGNMMGNKGGVAIEIQIGNTKLVVVNSHLAAQQRNAKQRNADFHTINNNMPSQLSQSLGTTLIEYADRLVFMGDLNYRIRGNRSAVCKLIELNMHEVMLKNDQLILNKDNGLIFQNMVEAPLNFKPTYKYDVNSDEYDTGIKRRIPAWTDRILFKPEGLECLQYDCESNLRTSDHRPVFATFKVSFDINSQQNDINDDFDNKPQFVSESSVCRII